LITARRSLLSSTTRAGTSFKLHRRISDHEFVTIPSERSLPSVVADRRRCHKRVGHGSRAKERRVKESR
jgi:hypothetical protein